MILVEIGSLAAFHSNQLSYVEKEVKEVKQRMLNVDPCEIRFKGLPSFEPDEYDDTINTQLKFFKCQRAFSSILDIHKWTFSTSVCTNLVAKMNISLRKKKKIIKKKFLMDMPT